VNNFKVIVTPVAKDDLADIIAYLQDFGKGIAKRYRDEIMKKLRFIGKVPNVGALVRVDELRSEGIRWTNFKNYMIFYTFNEEKCEVIIRHIAYGKRDLNKLFGKD